MIRDVKGLLRTRLDKLMTPFRLSAPMFYAGHQSARVIGDRKGPGGAETPPPAPASQPA